MVLLKERIGKLIECIGELIYSAHYPIEEYRMLHTTRRLSDEAGVDTSGWELMHRRDLWGGHREFYYFETNVTVLPECEGKTLVYELRTGKEGEWDALNPQFLVYVNGVRKHGLDVNHRQVLLTECARAGETFRILLSAFSGDNNFSLLLDSEYQVLEKDVEQYYYDLLVPYETARLLAPDSMEHIDIIQSLNTSLNLLDLRRPYSEQFYSSLKKAQAYMTEEFYGKKCGKSSETICCVGHTHIDCAWLWTLETTKDKAVRSFSTVLSLMERYPEFRFMSSQPQLYDYVKKNAPDVYAKIKERVAEGRWEPEGATWVEPDCNLAGGESLVRQFMYGLRFFEEEFHKKNEILWLADVFGYSAALPQIMRKCGIKYFMTTKISWNEFNKMPYDTFLWEGIDGTKVLTHFSSSRDYGAAAVEGGTETEHFTTYNAMLNPSMVKGNWQRYSQKALHTESLLLYGYGDGGGGPTAWMLENQRRMEKGIPGCPKTKQSLAQEFFHKLEEDVTGNRFLPKWTGELYLEYHRGTYTSMARNKRYNRKAEFAYENLELYGIMGRTLLNEAYPAETLKEGWEVILRNQFHDILPGSSIFEVYEDSKAEYEKILDASGRETERLLQNIADHVEGEKQSLIVFNPNDAARCAPLFIQDELLCGCPAAEGFKEGCPALSDGGQLYPLQKVENGYAAVVGHIPGKGYKKYQVVSDDAIAGRLDLLQAAGMIRSEREVETPYFSVKLNESGQFISIYDKTAGRELIPAGQTANRLMTYEDKPHNYDAWDINNYYTEKSWEINELSSIKIVENGPVRACIRLQYTYLDSVLTQYLYFYHSLRCIDIRNEIDWKEQQVLLRDEFPVDIHTDEATFEIQYGNVKRPTHSNTMWDFAKFEVCAHKWLDVSEDGYGVSILNDCKYGCSVRDGVIGLSMLKSAVYPNPQADKEHHTFWYSICPHEGDFRQGGIVQKAYLFNNPLRAVKKEQEGGSLPQEYSCVGLEADHAAIEVVKEAESGGAVVIRLYEYCNRRGSICVNVGERYTQAWEADLLENKTQQLDLEDGRIHLFIKPYEIKTIVVC